jgi:ComEC/Rec2-related protein
MPWGRRYETALEEVDIAGVSTPTSGGLRANLYNCPGDANSDIDPSQRRRAGDRVKVLVRARPPRNFLDPGAFDLRGYLARQEIDLIGSLRSGELLTLIDRPTPTILQRLARGRGDLLARLDRLFADLPQRLAVLRPMLLGDRTFVDSDVAMAFQKTGAYHVLVVAGLHVGALAVFIFWLGRRLRFSVGTVNLLTILTLMVYVGMVQDRPPILRASLMVALYLCARPLFRRVDLLNTIAIAALVILLWRPSSLGDSGFQLSFLAAVVIAGLALPWLDRSNEPYRAGLAHLGDVTRDIVHPPKIIQFRIEMRVAEQWFASRTPTMDRKACRFSAGVANPRRPAALGSRGALSCHSMGHDAADGPGFSPRHPGRPAEQYSSRAVDGLDRAARISRTGLDFCLGSARMGARTSAWFLHRPVARNRQLVQPLASHVVSRSRPSHLADSSVFCGICFCCCNGAIGCSPAPGSNRTARFASSNPSCRMDFSARTCHAHNPRCHPSIRAHARKRKARSEHPRRGPGRFGLRWIPQWPHAAG